jgi:hypothetical protein
LGAAGDVGVVEAEMERLSHVVRRDMDLVGVAGAGGVMGLDHNAIELWRDGGARVRLVFRRRTGAEGSALFILMGAEKADPMSERVSERTCMRIEGAM